MERERSGILRLDYIQNERGAMLAVTIIFLFFVSFFLFTLVSCHNVLYRTYDSLETYYENETKEIMRLDNENTLSI